VAAGKTAMQFSKGELLMFIFHCFKSRHNAERFAIKVGKLNIQTMICDSQSESDSIDPFPFELEPSIVLVERFDMRSPILGTQEEIDDLVAKLCGKKPDPDGETLERICGFAEKLGGVYAGT
jgi:hypothetical protein